MRWIVATVVVTAAIIGVGLAVGIDGRPGADAACLLTGGCDCEAVRTGVLRQPTAGWTSLAFVPLGFWLAADRRHLSLPGRVLFGATAVGVGLASFLAHATVTDWGRLLDSLAIKALLITFIVYPLSRRQSWGTGRMLAAWGSVTGAVVLTELIWPAAARPLLGSLAVAAIVMATVAAGPQTRRWLIGGLGVIGLGAGAWWLGRTDGALCDPHAALQLHGVWHILAAAGIASVYQVYRNEKT